MALAVLELLDYDDAHYQFQIDTGTNRYYQLQAGTSVRRDAGIDLVEDVYYKTPLAKNTAGGDLFHSETEISVPARYFTQRGTQVQLFSFKTPDRKSPAFSRAIRLPVGFKLPPRSPSDFAASFSETTVMNGTTYRTPRRIPCRSAALARQASIDDVLGSILKFAAPIVTELLKTPAGNGAGAGAAAAPAGIVAQLLKAILGAVPGAAGPALATPQSRSVAVDGSRLSRQFIFGIDDALVGAAIGQLVQVLPQLANAANQKRIEIKKADNQLTAGILAGINQRLMLDKLAELQKQPQAGGSPSPEQIQQLLALLQQAPAAAPAAAAPATQQSLMMAPRRAYAFSNRATLSFDLAQPVSWNGTPKILFSRNQKLVLKVRLNVAEPVPKTPLPKAILKIVFKDSAEPAVQFEKTFKHKDVAAGSVLECTFEPGELAHLPVGKSIAAVAELRWITAKTRRETRALGSTDIVLVNKYFLGDQAKETGPEIELRDMKQYRAFWNKLWEAPVLDAATPSNGRKKYMWDLDVNVRYSVLLSANHDSNGVMEPKLLEGKKDPESLTQKTEGRMKAGVELSVAELNKLQSLWNAEPLDPGRLEAFGAAGFLNSNATEFQHRLKLKGKAGQRGMVWVVPVFKMFGFKLAAASSVDDTGQVVTVAEEDTHFPLPVAARVIGLTATNY